MHRWSPVHQREIAFAFYDWRYHDQTTTTTAAVSFGKQLLRRKIIFGNLKVRSVMHTFLAFLLRDLSP